MAWKAALIILLLLIIPEIGSALEPHEILVIANSDLPESVRIAKYYCSKRKVPKKNIFTLSLGATLREDMSREEYETKLAGPIRKKLTNPKLDGKIKCLLTIYGIPIKVGKRRTLKGKEEKLKQLNELKNQAKQKLTLLEQSDTATSSTKKENIKRQLAKLQFEIDPIVGNETQASVDSELSIVLHGDYELYRWQPNILKADFSKTPQSWVQEQNLPEFGSRTLMVCRLDGPDFKIVQGLIDKAITTEKTGLKGIAYIDSQGITNDVRTLYSHSFFDESLRNLAKLTRLQTTLSVKEEQTKELFEPNSCPDAAIYCGWYSLQKYIDAFDFVDGAVGYHIASLEAADLRDPNSSHWCPAMLTDGITATLGAVNEPYLHSFPLPSVFFTELFKGRCLVEAYYRTKPFNSWQLILIGDPLYRPFKKR